MLLITWLGFMAMFAALLYGAYKSFPEKRYIKTRNGLFIKYVRVNKYQ